MLRRVSAARAQKHLTRATWLNENGCAVAHISSEFVDPTPLISCPGLDNNNANANKNVVIAAMSCLVVNELNVAVVNVNVNANLFIYTPCAIFSDRIRGVRQ